MIVRPAKRIAGEIHLPGDKSISHRAAMFASIAVGTTRIENFASSADCASTLDVLRRLGVSIERAGSSVKVHGVGMSGLRGSDDELDCGNSGTTMRLMAGILAGQPFDSVLTGDASLAGRPMKRIIEPLQAMGARIESVEGHAPLKIGGSSLHAIDHAAPVASAQVKSCVLLAGLFADGETSVTERVMTRDHTERMLRWFGVEVRTDDLRHSVRGGSVLQARDLSVPADISSAAFFMVAAACLEGSKIVLPGVGMNPARRGVVDVMRQFGAQIEITNERAESNEPVADIVMQSGRIPASTPNRLDGARIADVIDEIPVLAVFGTQLDGGLEVRDASELRVKESDRIAAVVENLKRMGAYVEEFPDGFRVGRSKLHAAAVDSFGDHRIAMAFAVAGLLATGETRIEGAECAAVSFPDFFDVLDRVAQR
jgi:3-phosphoshikimate 1-carboxyvinyltransferase